jgi:CubicO group peptidase (beta-lactamase class C family)
MKLDSATQAIKDFAEQQMRSHATPGLALALTDAREVRTALFAGYSDVSAGTPVSSRTAFGIGSVTKSLSAITALQLRDQGMLDLDRPVDHYLPWLRLGPRLTSPNCRQLLTHTAGIPNGGLGTGGSRFEIAQLADLPFAGPTGAWSYSNLGYQILGYVLEEVGAEPHTDLLRRRILQPLGMTRTFAPAQRASAGDELAAGYQWADLHPVRPDEPAWRIGRFSYAGNESDLASTASDLARLVQVLLGEGSAGPVRVLRRESANEMCSAHVRVRPGVSYGYGLYLYEVGDRLWLSHSGRVPGYGTTIIADLSMGVGLALLTNGPGNPSTLARYALIAWESALRGEQVPPPPGPSRHEIPDSLEGEFTGPRGDITIQLADEWHVESAGRTAPVIGRGECRFYCSHPAFDDFCFTWIEDEGKVARLYHGPDLYLRTSEYADRSKCFGACPEQWRPFLGHYRSYNPWMSNFHIVIRERQLALLMPNGHEWRLFKGDGGCFAIGSADGPDYLKFDSVVEGVSLRCSYSGTDYFRAPWSRGQATL